MRGLAYWFDHCVNRVDQTILVTLAWTALFWLFVWGLAISFILN